MVRNPGGHSSTNTPHWLRMTAPQPDGHAGSPAYRIPCFRSMKYEPYVVVKRTDNLPECVEKKSGLKQVLTMGGIGWW